MAETCPNCGEYIRGRTCTNCGINPHTADVVRCHKCSDKVLEKDARETNVQDPITANYETRHFCPDCHVQSRV